MRTLVICAMAAMACFGCDKPKGPDGQRLDSPQAFAVTGGLVTTVNGLAINSSTTRSLPWLSTKTGAQLAPAILSLGEAHSPQKSSGNRLAPYRYFQTGDYLLVCAYYVPPIRDGSFSWVIDTRAMSYVGHFLDEEAR